MDPLTILFFSLLVVLVASIIVNIFYVTEKYKNRTKVATTQRENFLAIDSDTQTINDAIPVSQCDEEIQV